jgi:NSS family neurotransmitter:Na+ symporter
MREEWASRTGFILATIGAAVGLGNIWRFSYIAGENGGGVFLLVYLVFVFVIGLPLVIAEMALGRRGQGDAVTAFETALPPKPGVAIGWLSVGGAILILSYYAVIAGWALKYFFGALTGGLWATLGGGYGAYFEDFISHKGEPVLWQSVMLLATGAIVAGGVRAGIERVNFILMPLLAFIVLGLAIFSLTLPGSSKGVSFLFTPDFAAFGRPSLYLNALGQAFFSIGVGMAVFVTYASYLGRSTAIPGAASTIILGDTLFAIVAGLAIFPAVFALGGDPAAGPRLAFITFPQILLEMPAGRVIGIVFFLLLSAAALTSMVSLLEVPVALAAHRLGWPRTHAVAASCALIFLLGVPSAMSYGVLAQVHLAGLPILDAIDHAVSNFVLPLGGLAIALSVGWVLGRENALKDSDLEGRAIGAIWLWILRIAVPLMIATILLRSAGLL